MLFRMRARFAVSFLLVVGVLVTVLLTVSSLQEDVSARRQPAPSAPPPLRTEEAEAPVPPPHLVGSVRAGAPGIETPQASRVTVRGIVLDADGVPRGGAVVILRHVDAGPRTIGTRRTAGAGRFAFEGLEPGTYVAELLAAPGLLGDASKFPVGESGADVVLRLGRSSSVRLTVVTEDGEPVEGAQLLFEPAHTATTDAEGVAHLLHVDPRRKGTLTVAAPRRSPQDLFGRTIASWSPRDDRVVLERALLLEGRVLDEHGRPWAGCSVGCRRPGEEVGGWRSSESRSDGSFTFEELRSGGLELSAAPPGAAVGWDATVVAARAGEGNVSIELPRGHTLTIEISNWGTREGHAGHPRPHVVLTALGRVTDARRVAIDGDGRAHVEGLPEGIEYLLGAELSPLSRSYLLVERVRASSEILRVALAEGGTIEGRLVLPARAAAPHVALRGPGVSRPGVVDRRAGTFRLYGVPPGRWTVSGYATVYGHVIARGPKARREGRRTWSTATEASAGDEVVLTLQEEP